MKLNCSKQNYVIIKLREETVSRAVQFLGTLGVILWGFRISYHSLFKISNLTKQWSTMGTVLTRYRGGIGIGTRSAKASGLSPLRWPPYDSSMVSVNKRFLFRLFSFNNQPKVYYTLHGLEGDLV